MKLKDKILLIISAVMLIVVLIFSIDSEKLNAGEGSGENVEITNSAELALILNALPSTNSYYEGTVGDVTNVTIDCFTNGDLYREMTISYTDSAVYYKSVGIMKDPNSLNFGEDAESSIIFDMELYITYQQVLLKFNNYCFVFGDGVTEEYKQSVEPLVSVIQDNYGEWVNISVSDEFDESDPIGSICNSVAYELSQQYISINSSNYAFFRHLGESLVMEPTDEEFIKYEDDDLPLSYLNRNYGVQSMMLDMYNPATPIVTIENKNYDSESYKFKYINNTEIEVSTSSMLTPKEWLEDYVYDFMGGYYE